jgi:hypothetical protein
VPGYFASRRYQYQLRLLTIDDPYNEECYKDKEWYKNWWKYDEAPKHALELDRDYDGVGRGVRESDGFDNCYCMN